MQLALLCKLVFLTCLGITIGLLRVQRYGFFGYGYPTAWRGLFPLPHGISDLKKCSWLCLNQSSRGFSWDSGKNQCSYTYSWYAENSSFAYNPTFLHYQIKSPSVKYYTSCKDVFNNFGYVNNIYDIMLPNGTIATVPCVAPMMRVQLNQQYVPMGKFNTRTWTEYKNGFGDYFSSFWIGNEILHVLTASKMYSLRFCAYLVTSNTSVCVTYNNVSILSESENYTLVLGPIAAGPNNLLLDISAQHNNTAFTTFDRDNDNNPTGNCATIQGGGFWYNNCFLINPNGMGFTNYATNQTNGIIYPAFNGYLPLTYITLLLVLP